jgi:small ligand-binding sensory domain FIST
VIYELNTGKPMEALQKLIGQVSPRDQELLRHSLFLGIEMKDDGKSRFDQGDFLIRDVAGIDPSSGAMAVQGVVKDYQVVQFHLRDALTSTQDLERRLARLKRNSGHDAEGALFFSCLGRGEGLYGVANHDSDLFCRHMGAVPMGGFFGNGEIGPVGGSTFLHGYTSSFAIFSSSS